MGQTLTHGVYLPDEGERNCYNGLAGNWQLLDNSVGTIAEHTSALAGKAPLVHTHTKADITDFPALATVATSGSYNDLSNIPASFTPASHSHGNITNDGKVGTAANKPLITGTDGVVQAGSFGTAANTFCEGNDSRLSDARTPVAHTHAKADITDLFNSANTWSNYNSYSKGIELAGNRYAYILPEFAANYSGISILTNSFGKSVKFGSYTTDENNVVSLDTTLGFVEISAGLANDVNSARILPRNAAVADLGTSTKKWKTLNGVNPGALSLPKIVTKNTANIASAIVGADGETQYLDGTDNNYTAALDGWISMCISGFTQSNELWITVYDQQNETWGTSAESSTSARNNLFIIFPIRANQKMRIRMRCNSVVYARFYPCEGNV